MQRILAEILEIKELPGRTKKSGYSEYLLKVRLKEAASKGYVLPPRVKGRVHLIVRKFGNLWSPKKEDEVILTPREVEAFFNPLRVEPLILEPKSEEIKFKLIIHNPTGKKLDYRVIFPSGKEIKGRLTQEEQIRTPLLEGMADGCHPIYITCGNWNLKTILPLVKPGCVYSYKTDVNGDGFEERIVENEFLRLSLAPHLGGRTESVWLKNSQSDMLSRTFEYDKDEYVEYGGCDEHIGEFPGELWKAKFREEKQRDASVALSYSWKGFKIEKEVNLFPSLPLVHHTVKIGWRGKGEKDILYWHRMAMVLDNPTWASVVNIQTAEQLGRMRHTPPPGWWRERKEYYQVKLGAIVYSNENRKETFCLMTDPNSLEFAACTSLKGLYLVTPYFKRKKLKSKEEVEFHYVYILGEDFHLDSENCFIACTTPWRKGRRFVAIIGRTEQPIDKIECNLSPRESIILLSRQFNGVGALLIGNKEIHSKGKMEVKFRLGEKEYSLRLKEDK